MSENTEKLAEANRIIEAAASELYALESDNERMRNEMADAAMKIDAAADMLEALKAVAPLMIPGMNWTDEIGQEVKSMVNSAIAKAEGRHG